MFLPRLTSRTLSLPQRADTQAIGDPRQTSKLCDLADWDDPCFEQVGWSIMGGAPTPHFKHRKLWEFIKLVRALEAQQLLTPQSIGISVAAGHERVLYYLAQKISRMVATDIYGHGSFQGDEATAEVLREAKKFAPYPYPEERLDFLYMNALALSFPDAVFDFSFSLSSIEHFGGVAPACAAIREMARVVRPGGLVMVATDCSLNGYANNEVFTPAQIQTLIEHDTTLELLTPFDWHLSDATLETLIDARRDDTTKLPHINLRSFGSIFTSVALIFRKKGEGAQAYPDRFRIVEETIAQCRLAHIPHGIDALSPLEYVMKRVKEKSRTATYHLQECVAGVASALRS